MLAWLQTPFPLRRGCLHTGKCLFATRSRFSLHVNIFLGDFFVCFVNSLKISRHCLKQVQLKPINPDLFLRTFFPHETQLASLQLCYWLQQIVLFLMSLPSMKPLQASHTKSFMRVKQYFKNVVTKVYVKSAASMLQKKRLTNSISFNNRHQQQQFVY